eukprot:617966-Alexandrium_andersonii.AAC.1
MCIRDSLCPPPPGTPSEPPEQPLSLSDSESARTAAQTAPLESFGDNFRGRSWARAGQASNV